MKNQLTTTAIKKVSINNIVKEIKSLCNQNRFEEAGKISRKHKSDFIQYIKDGGNERLLIAYKICGYFNMRQTDCFNLKF